LWIPLHGVVPSGRASAVTAGIRDPNAIYFNPAALALIDEHTLLVDAAWIDLWLSFQRADAVARNGESISFEEVNNESPGIAAPQLLFSARLAEEWALGLGLYTPWAARARFPTRGPQRYSVVDLSGSMIINAHLAVAWRPHPRFSFGAGLINTFSILDGVGVASTYVGLWGEPEDPDLDSLVHIRATDLFSLSFNAGLWFEPVDGLELALSVTGPTTISDDHASFETQLPSHYVFDDTYVDGDTMGLAMDLPWMVRAGIRYAQAAFDIELDLHWESWSVQQKVRTWPNNVRIMNVPTVGSIQADRLNIDRRMQDSYGIALGGDWRVLPELLVLRAGLGFESGSAPDEMYSVFEYDSDKLYPTLGASVLLDPFSIDVSYAYVAQLPRQIRNSQARQVNSAYPEGATVIANGDYESGYNVIGLGFRVAF
jgi:long-chain fatty acid transport protein